MKQTTKPIVPISNYLKPVAISQQLGIASHIIETCVNEETYKFSEIVNTAYKIIGFEVKDIFAALKSVYTAYKELAPDDIYNKMDSTRGFDLTNS